MDGLPNKSYLSQQAQHPLRSPTVDEALEKCPSGGPFHIKLIAEWDFDTKTAILEKIPDPKVSFDLLRILLFIYYGMSRVLRDIPCSWSCKFQALNSNCSKLHWTKA